MPRVGNKRRGWGEERRSRRILPGQTQYSSLRSPPYSVMIWNRLSPSRRPELPPDVSQLRGTTSRLASVARNARPPPEARYSPYDVAQPILIATVNEARSPVP